MVRTDGDTADVGEGQHRSVDSVRGQVNVGDHQHTCKGGVQLHQQPGLSEEVGDDGNMHALMHGDEPGVEGHGDGVRGEGAQEEGQGCRKSILYIQPQLMARKVDLQHLGEL